MLTAIDLFAGCGGLSLGLIRAGWTVAAAVEHNADACATYRALVGDHVMQTDITTLDPAALPDADLIAGGPPCQGFSYAGKRDAADPRNALWRHFLRIVAAKRPRWVLIENVRGMLTMGEDKPLILAFRAIGYDLTPYLLNAADYGVPQTRIRVFYVGNRIGAANPCPTPTHAKPPRHLLLGLAPWITVRQALGIGGTLSNGHFGGARHAFEADETAWTFGQRPHVELLMREERPADPTGRRSIEWDGSANPSRTLGHNPHHILDEPARARQRGAHGQPGYSPRHIAGYVPDDILDSPSSTIRHANGGHDITEQRRAAQSQRRPQGWVPNIPLDDPAPTIQGGGGETGGAEPVPHRLRMSDQRNPSNGRSAFDDGGESPARAIRTEPGCLADDFEYAPTIQGDSRVSRPGHHVPNDPRMGLRRLTVDECAILQGFDPGTVFHGTKTSRYRQVGNAVPPRMAMHLGRAILEAGR